MNISGYATLIIKSAPDRLALQCQTSNVGIRLMRLLKSSIALGLAWALSGCGAYYMHGPRLPDLVWYWQDKEDDMPYSLVSPGQSWISVPQSQVVVQRSVRGATEQVVGLPSKTAVPGEDQIIMYAYPPGYLGSGLLHFADIKKMLGKLPHPFEDASEDGFVAGQDSLGDYVWQAKEYGSVTCVLALRRIDSTRRALPQGVQSLDLVLRNCVFGSSDDALAPIMEANLAASSAAGSGTGSSRMMSPLAAPM